MFAALYFTSVGAETVFVRDDIIRNPTPEKYSVCYNNSCATLATITLTSDEWSSVRNQMSPSAKNPAEEREQLTCAIALLETFSGRYAGTDADLERNRPGLGRIGQMDCIDESTNTTTYLRLLAGAGLLQLHSVSAPVTRGWFIRGWPHTTAVIRERDTGDAYAVDSWFEDNGAPPYIVPLSVWRDGWVPTRPVAGRPTP